MHMKILDATSFKIMPWKNGKGKTTELFREDIDGEMAFRLSQAVINENGFFSIFERMNRYLVILQGKGCSLEMGGSNYVIGTKEILHFSGEEKVHATLLEDPVIDFNIFYNPEIYSCEVRWVSNEKIGCDTKAYIYSVSMHQLVIIEGNEEFLAGNDMIVVNIKKAP